MSEEDLRKVRLVLAELEYELKHYDATISKGFMLEKTYSLIRILTEDENEPRN